MNIIYTPKVGTSDIEVKLCEIFKNETIVKRGDIFCIVETSKSTYEIESEYEGYIYLFRDLNENITVGAPLALVNSTELNKDELKSIIDSILIKTNNDIDDNVNITKKARLLIEKHSVDISSFNKELITEKDVLDLISSQNDFLGLDNIHFEDDDIVIVGIGGHAGMCIDILKSNSNLRIVGFLDDAKTEDLKYGLKYLGKIDSIQRLSSKGLKFAILGIGFIGNLKQREKVYNYISGFVEIPTIIHSKAIIESSASIGPGCQIMAGSIIGSNVFIGRNCIINSGAIISHDCVISDGTHITPGAVLAGHVKIGERVTVGMCSTVYLGLDIPDDSIIINGKSVI